MQYLSRFLATIIVMFSLREHLAGSTEYMFLII
jgi:hypothetical protein